MGGFLFFINCFNFSALLVISLVHDCNLGSRYEAGLQPRVCGGGYPRKK